MSRHVKLVYTTVMAIPVHGSETITYTSPMKEYWFKWKNDKSSPLSAYSLLTTLWTRVLDALHRVVHSFMFIRLDMHSRMRSRPYIACTIEITRFPVQSMRNVCLSHACAMKYGRHGPLENSGNSAAEMKHTSYSRMSVKLCCIHILRVFFR